MKSEKLYFRASDISIPEEQPNARFMSVVMRMCTTLPNQNQEGVTEAFIDEIIMNPQKYNCTPLYVDRDKLLAHDYDHLGHMYDAMTGEFATTQVGGFHQFRKVADQFGTSLYGEARIPKRETEICSAVMELYKQHRLNFSFEICYDPANVKEIDGVRYIDVSPANSLTGMAIVSVPAYPEATALSLCAEKKEQGVEEQKPEDERKEPTMKTEAEKAIVDQVEENPVTEEQPEMTVAETQPAVAEENPAVENSDAQSAIAEDATAETQETTDAATAETEQTEVETKAPDERDARIEDLEKQLAEFDAMKAELAKLKDEKALAEAQAKTAKISAFAERLGLDAESEAVKQAIAELNYEALADLVPEKQEQNEETVDVAVAAFTDMKADPVDPYGGIVSHS